MPCCLWDSGGLVRFLRVARPNWLPCTITVLFNCSTSEMKLISIRDFFLGFDKRRLSFNVRFL